MPTMTPSKATAAIAEPPELLKADLGWLCGQMLTAYLRGADSAINTMPGGMRGYLVLAAAASGCANNQIEVARRLGVDRSVMVGLLDNLEQAGLVARRPNPTDRRERAIELTTTGTKRLAAIQTQLEAVTAHLLAPQSATQRDGFLEALHSVVAHIALSEGRLSANECG
jgi:DNA-binding MarR family transcriptional regulator